MNVSLTNVDSVNAIIQINIDKADYQEKVERALKNFRKKANIPGFRPGAVPMGMVKKMHGKSILAEEINNIVGESLYNYIQENKLNVLGEPLPNQEKQQAVDFGVEGDFEFFFDVALAPEIKLSLTQKDKIDYYKLEVTDELIEKQLSSFKSNHGKYESVKGAAKLTDLLKGNVVELENGAPKEGGITVDSAVLMASYMKDEEEQDKFDKTNVGAVITFNPGKAYEGNAVEIASFLQIEKDAIGALSPEFSYEVTEVTRYQEAELNQDLFDKVLGEGVVKTEAEFRENVRESLSAQLSPDSDYKFLLDARELLMKKTENLEFPDAFLKRWLLASGKERTAESIEEEYPKIIEDLKFHLIKEQISKENELKVEENEVKAAARVSARAQFAQYGMMNLPDDMVENYASEMMKNQENVRNLVDRAMENKIIEFLKTKLGITEKNISVDEFKKFFEQEEA